MTQLAHCEQTPESDKVVAYRRHEEVIVIVPRVHPVIHVLDAEQADAQAEVALAMGADGVFLIHDDVELIIDAFNAVRAANETAFIGINMLIDDPLSGFALLNELLDAGDINAAPDAFWFDDATGGSDDWDGVEASLEALAVYREKSGLLDVTFFGGLSFKGTHHYSDDPQVSADLVHRFGHLIDVVTASGRATGTPPSADKLEAMANVADIELAVASGVSVEILTDLTMASHLLVASSVETQPFSGRFVPEKLRALINAAHALD